MSGEQIVHYCIDEAGDSSLWNRRGKLLVGTQGCSRFFMMGLVRVADQELLDREMNELRQSLLADPYFKNVPSMQPAAGKTALHFHAKDDPPEVRREVFRLLLKHDITFDAVVRDKLVAARISRLQHHLCAERHIRPYAGADAGIGEKPQAVVRDVRHHTRRLRPSPCRRSECMRTLDCRR